MAGEDGGVVGQAEQALADAFAKLFVVAARKVGAPDAAAEERVAGEDPAFHLGVEAHAATGMAGRANHLQGALPYLDDFAVFQVVVGHLDFSCPFRHYSEPHGVAFGLSEIGLHVGVRRHLYIVVLFDGGIAYDMVDVAMRANEAVAVDEAEELVFLACRGAARVDDDAFEGVFVVNDVGAFREGIEDEGFEFEHGFLFDG